jgi:DNA-directed RNA polymerase subunit M/transcription elongation factor TFIIS
MSYTISNPETFRTNIREKIKNILEEDELTINLEKGVFNYAIQEATYKKIIKKWENPSFVQLYTDRLRTIYMNLKNENIVFQLKSKELTPHTFAFMTHQEMNTKHWEKLIEKKQILDKNKYTTNIEASTNLFTCKKCKSKRCTYYTLQTRSCDEPETIFITCLDCGKNFKKN